MGKKISSFVAAVLMLVFGLCAQAETPEEVAQKMNVEQKVGQVMIWSFSGTDLNAEIESTLTKYQLGAFIFFRRNIVDNRQTAKLNTDLQRFAAKKLKAPLFLMIDQEGGVVTRVRLNTPIPSALALGKIDDAAFVETFARTKGDLLQALGFNVNLAPVMDISNPNKDSFIGNRTFGDEPETVSELSMAYSKGMNAAGIIPTGKHFPGHGGTISDSHQTTPKKMISTEDLEKRDLVPFKQFAEAEFPKAIMTAHLAMPNVDPSGLPATYSPYMIQERLREKLGYKGVVFTDDLEMNGAAISSDVGERAVRAFLAGNDMLMLAGSQANQRRAYRSVLTAVQQGRISAERLHESVVRILEAKMQLKLGSAKTDERKAAIAVKKLDELSKEAMNKNFKMAMDARTKEWPDTGKNTQVLVLSATQGFFYRFQKEFKGKSKFYTLSPATLGYVVDEIANPKVNIAIFYASGVKTARWLNTLTPELKAKTIVVNCNHAGEVEDQESFLSVLNLNSHSPESGAWLGAALSEEKAEEPATPPKEDDDPNSTPSDVRTPAGDPEEQ